MTTYIEEGYCILECKADGTARRFAIIENFADRQTVLAGLKALAVIEEACRAAGWTHGGDNGGIVYNTADFDSWKAAASWGGGNGPRIYDSWTECFKGQSRIVVVANDVYLREG